MGGTQNHSGPRCSHGYEEKGEWTAPSAMCSPSCTVVSIRLYNSAREGDGSLARDAAYAQTEEALRTARWVRVAAGSRCLGNGRASLARGCYERSPLVGLTEHQPVQIGIQHMDDHGGGG